MCLILIADDHPIAREPLARLLRYEGYETACAANGIEALQQMQDRRPDLILLDMMMPKMGGLEFLHAARANFRLAPKSGAGDAADTKSEGLTDEVPVIVMTSVVDTSDVTQARAMGVRDVIPKAKFTIDELLRRVRAHLPAQEQASIAPDDDNDAPGGTQPTKAAA